MTITVKLIEIIENNMGIGRHERALELYEQGSEISIYVKWDPHKGLRHLGVNKGFEITQGYVHSRKLQSKMWNTWICIQTFCCVRTTNTEGIPMLFSCQPESSSHDIYDIFDSFTRCLFSTSNELLLARTLIHNQDSL